MPKKVTPTTFSGDKSFASAMPKMVSTTADVVSATPIEVVSATMTGKAFEAAKEKGQDYEQDCEECAALCVDYARITKECQTTGVSLKRVSDYCYAMEEGAEWVILMAAKYDDAIIMGMMHMAPIYAICDYARKHRAAECYSFPPGIISSDEAFTDYGKKKFRAGKNAWKIKEHTNTFLETVVKDQPTLDDGVNFGSQLLMTFFVKRAKGISKVLLIGGFDCQRAHASWVDVSYCADPA